MNRALAALAGLAVAAWGVWHFTAIVREFYGAIIIDDAYITFRYAENWAAGYGPTWNVGEPAVEGYTTPLLMALLAAGRAVGIPVVSFATAIGAASGVMALLLTGVLACRLTHSVGWALVAVGMLAANPVHAVWTVSGMETPLYTALAIGIVLAFELAVAARTSRWRWTAVGVLLALLALTRTEGPLFAGVLGLLLLSERREPLPVRRVVTVLTAVAAVVLVHVALRRLYYGLLLPLPVYEKGHQLAGFGIVKSFLVAYWVYLALGVVALIGERRASAAQALRFGAITFALLCVVVLNVDPVMGHWHRYFAPMLPVMMVAAAAGLRYVGRAAHCELAVLALLAVALVPFGERMIGVSRPRFLEEVRSYGQWVNQSHVTLGHWLAKHVPERNATLVLSDCGVVPYFSRLRVIDLFGLNDPFIARHGVDPDYVFGKRPELIVLTPLHREDPLRSDARLVTNYLRVGTFDGIYPLDLYRRRDYPLR